MVSRFLGFSHRDHAGIDAVRLYVESPALSLARKCISADERETTENRMARMASLMCGASPSRFQAAFRLEPQLTHQQLRCAVFIRAGAKALQSQNVNRRPNSSLRLLVEPPPPKPSPPV